MIYLYHVIIVLSVVLKVSYSFTGVFWHVCDIHLNDTYNNSQQNEGRFGNYLSDSSYPLVQSAIKAMKYRYEKPDFIIWNGDNVAHMRLVDNSFFNIIQNVSMELRLNFPKAEILPSLGNHDINPSNQLSDQSTWCEKLLSHWTSFINNSEEIKTFKKGCFYSRTIGTDNDKIKVIVLNTVIWYSINQATKNLIDPYEQFQWMETELQDARKNNWKVFIVGHVPPGSSEYTPRTYKHLHPQFNERLVEILRNNHDIIEAGFFSHEHTDSFKIVYSSKGRPIIPLFLSPSVTPFHLRNLGSVNPSIRLYTWSATATERSYQQLHTTLPDHGHQSSLTWTTEYNSSSLLPSLSAASMDLLLTDFSLPTSLYFQTFFLRHLSGRPHDHNETCPANSSCRCQIICGMKWLLYVDLDACLADCDRVAQQPKIITPPRVSQVAMIVSVIAVFTLILIATVVGVNKVYCHQRRSASLTRDIFMASYNGKNCEEIVEDHIDHIAEKTFGDVPEYRGHIRNNSRTILTLNDGNEIVEVKSQSAVSKFAISKKDKPQEKYDYSRM